MMWEDVATVRLKRIRWRIQYLTNLGEALAYEGKRRNKPTEREAAKHIKSIIGLIDRLESEGLFYESFAGTVPEKVLRDRFRK